MRARIFAHAFVELTRAPFPQTFNLHVASPVVPGSGWQTMNTPGPLHPARPNDFLYGRLVTFIEIQLTAFDYKGWTCFWTMINTTVDTIGFGYDMCFYRLCGLRMGMLDSFNATHDVGNTHATSGGPKAMDEMYAWLETRKAAQDYFSAPCELTNQLNFTVENLPPVPVTRRSRPWHKFGLGTGN